MFFHVNLRGALWKQGQKCTHAAVTVDAQKSAEFHPQQSNFTRISDAVCQRTRIQLSQKREKLCVILSCCCLLVGEM